jgi:hypothetical protein
MADLRNTKSPFPGVYPELFRKVCREHRSPPLTQAQQQRADAIRLLALAEIYDGARRTKAARIGGVTLQIVRDWVLRFNDEGPDGLINRKAAGARRKKNRTHATAFYLIRAGGSAPSS